MDRSQLPVRQRPCPRRHHMQPRAIDPKRKTQNAIAWFARSLPGRAFPADYKPSHKSNSSHRECLPLVILSVSEGSVSLEPNEVSAFSYPTLSATGLILR